MPLAVLRMMDADALHIHDHALNSDSFAGRADASLAHSHPHKRRRTSYLTTQHDGGESAYGAVAFAGQDSRGYTAYSQPAPADPSYYLMHETAQEQHPHHQHHQQQPLYHSYENALENPMNTSYQGYMHDAPILNEPNPQTEPWDPQLFDPALQLKQQSLPVLEKLATQILETLAHNNLQEVIETASQPDSPGGQAYYTSVALFDQTKGYYVSREHIFLNAQSLNLEPSANVVIRKANLATFAVIIFAGRDIPFSQLHEQCLDVFLPEGHALTKSVASLFLELKTQAYIAALHNGTVSQTELLEYFPADMHSQLVRRRPGSPPLSPVEQDLALKVNMRRQQLLTEQYSSPQLRPLYSTWKWVDLLRVLSDCLRQVVHPSMPTPSMSSDYSGMIFSPDPQGSVSVQSTPQQDSAPFPIYQEPEPLPQRSLSNKSRTTSGRERSESSTSRSEKAPMLMQYENARKVSTSKSTPPSRRVSVASQRKPWSPEEERALMDGLDRVKGPHWSQILALYGVGGRISEALKERTQVQLKDKARNLKLFFLKSGVEVPTYLQGVTGELKTRAPAQAAKREREERMKAEREALEQQQQQRPP
ncbi:hypothetical protein NA57DRAFT_80095 [Rhizodiscina lignyota]|uniref:HTH myb-type domain-containing protein n=1 Tax=Rhizodiscina lignyota TaxID=1504668 RepID=A0A9P4I8N9_9PEZI|nr:hypothetical protein NA57DRAFT_80095 [Rhizodiscina lignyota]